jgi:acetate kinase
LLPQLCAALEEAYPTLSTNISLALPDGRRVRAVGHRVVHGGTHFAAPILVDSNLLAELRKLCPLAPLHHPHKLPAIEAIAATAPHIPQGIRHRYG